MLILLLLKTTDGEDGKVLPEFEMKLFKIIQLCKRSRNYSRLIEVGLKIISFEIKRIAIQMDIELSLLQKKKGLYRKAELVSILYEKTYHLTLIKKAHLEDIKLIEEKYTTHPEEIPYFHVKKVFQIYYSLRSIELAEDQTKEMAEDLAENLLRDNLTKKVHFLTQELEKEFSQEKFTELIQLQLINESFHDASKKQIKVEGALKESKHSKTVFGKEIEYFYLSLIILSFGIGFFLTVELTLFPYLFDVLSLFLFIAFGIAALMLLIYWKVFVESPEQKTYLNAVFNP
jgi:sulfur relay (sulfurtransferase) DsrF/TusC family protein